jgi:signal transduction histidine kinase
VRGRIPALPFERSDDRVVAGVCGGIAQALGVDATLVRLVFAFLALAGGAGILLYLALWVWTSGRRPVVGVALVALSVMAILFALGLPDTTVLGIGLIVAGIVLLVRRGASLRPGEGSFTVPGIALTMAGAVVMLGGLGSSPGFLGPGAVAGALLLVLLPWTWQVVSERGDRIRLEERAEVAARIHDSVLQTLALIQRHAGDGQRVTSLARRQERDLRRWLYGSGYGTAVTLVDALADAAADVEDAHGVRIEVASSGDAPLDEPLAQLVLAAREALANAAKHSGSDEIAVYSEAGAGEIAVFVRDRGAGFDRALVAEDRRGLAESIEARMQRAGGRATITTAPGEGTEVELTIPRGEA